MDDYALNTEQMGQTTSPAEFSSFQKENGDDLAVLRQNGLMAERRFLDFSKKRGVKVFGVGSGDPGRFVENGWLRIDQTGDDDTPLFHPFRLYPVHKILHACRLPIAPSSSVNREGFLSFVERVMERLPALEELAERSISWNEPADLAVLLEPVYWPEVAGVQRRSALLSEEAFDAAQKRYRTQLRDLVGRLDPGYWEERHRILRQDAAQLDENENVYLLLRLAPWNKRQQLKGAISGALWFRHMAEMLRRAFEEVHEVAWPEEDRAFGQWMTGARTMAYGSERPLDKPLESRPYLAWEFGLFTGSVVRWYVEGETEYYAIAEILPEAEKAGVELVNLGGRFGEKANASMKLSDHLKNDRALRRFSIISFDRDVADNARTVQRQVEQERVVGLIFPHEPDFEFGNFSLKELVEIAARFDEDAGSSGEVLRKADWSGATKSCDFESRYINLSARMPRSLKGEEWGAALARYAMEYPEREDSGTRRPLLKAIEGARRSRVASYDFQAEQCKIDPNTFELVKWGE